MKPDEEMIREAMDKTSGKGKDAMRDRIDVYRVACKLSRGGCPKRSAYWQERAARLADDIKRLTTPRREVPGRGCEQCV